MGRIYQFTLQPTFLTDSKGSYEKTGLGWAWKAFGGVPMPPWFP